MFNPWEDDEIPDFPNDVELKPCPFCSEQPIVEWDGEVWLIGCNNAECFFKDHDWIELEDWNKRGKEVNK